MMYEYPTIIIDPKFDKTSENGLKQYICGACAYRAHLSTIPNE